uniref:Defensin n=1 Tax=Ocypus mus TaxID=2992945 RepID=A0A9E8MA00_9COLE|nr:defensin [Ocypus mus]
MNLQALSTTFITVAMVGAASFPTEAVQDDGLNNRQHKRVRVTCDLLSAKGGFALNHSLCATHCLFRKRKGGHCNNSVCVCRN